MTIDHFLNEAEKNAQMAVKYQSHGNAMDSVRHIPKLIEIARVNQKLYDIADRLDEHPQNHHEDALDCLICHIKEVRDRIAEILEGK